jgi:hypothetical protein
VNVVVAAAAACVPAWQRDVVAALRAAPGFDVRVVRAGTAAPWTPPRGGEARFAGPALAPARIAFDTESLPNDARIPTPSPGTTAGTSANAAVFSNADLVVDLTESLADTGARLGVWSFRLGDGGDATLPFAREIAGGARVVTVDLVRRSGGERAILRSGHFAVSSSYSVTARLAFAEAAAWPAVLAAVADRVTLHATPETEPPRGAALRGVRRFVFVATAPFRAVTALLSGLVAVDQWNAGFASGGARALLAGGPLRDIRWLPAPPPRTFVADPFLVERDGVRALFVEEYDYKRDRGVIDALVLDAQDRVVERARIIDLPTHLSYPFPVEIDGVLHLVPENAAGGEVAAYRCVRFPDRWERAFAVFPSFDGVDTTLFRHDERWWAFCTRYTHGSNVALFGFHAADVRGPWTPHAQNPIVVDVRCARAAGPPFVVDGALYRPGQDCSTTYGGAVVIARIDELDPLRYAETIVSRIEAPVTGPYPDGLHTVGVSGDTIVLDGKRRYRDLRYVMRLGRWWKARRARRSALATLGDGSRPSSNPRPETPID